MRCVDCHNPHETVKYASGGLGIKTDCEKLPLREQDTYQKITDRRHAKMCGLPHARVRPRAQLAILNSSVVICAPI
jgi:hypothetical protein